MRFDVFLTQLSCLDVQNGISKTSDDTGVAKADVSVNIELSLKELKVLVGILHKDVLGRTAFGNSGNVDHSIVKGLWNRLRMNDTARQSE